MKNYELKIKTDITCPQRNVVRTLIEGKGDNDTPLKTIIGKSKIRQFYPLYIDEEVKENLYGYIMAIYDENGDELGEEETTSLINLSSINVKLEKVTIEARKVFFEGVIEVNEEENSNIDTSYISPKLQAIIDEKIKKGIVTKEDMDERMKVLQENKVDEALKIRVIKGYRKYNKMAHKPNCIYVDPYLEETRGEGIISEGLRNGISRMATICEGEKSVGKNVYMETIAWLLGMPLYMITFSRNMNPASIYGEKSTDNSASERLAKMQEEAKAKVMLNSPLLSKDIISNNDTSLDVLQAAADFELQKARAASVSIIVDQSELYDWLIDGGVMVFNEMNMAESNFFSSFTNPLTDGTGFLFFPGRGEVRMNKDCVLFGTQNADYEGVMQQNEATMSRFNTLYFKQPTSIIGQLKEATNTSLAKNGVEYKLENKYFEQAQKFYSQCLTSVRQGIVSNAILNIRGFVRALIVVAESEGHSSLKRWLEICVINTCPTDERSALLATLHSIVTL